MIDEEYNQAVFELHNEINKYLFLLNNQKNRVKRDITKCLSYLYSKNERSTLEPLYVQNEIRCRKRELPTLKLWRENYNMCIKQIIKLDKCLDISLNKTVITSYVRIDDRNDASTNVQHKRICTTILKKRLKALSTTFFYRRPLINQLAFKALKILESV